MGSEPIHRHKHQKWNDHCDQTQPCRHTQVFMLQSDTRRVETFKVTPRETNNLLSMTTQ